MSTLRPDSQSQQAQQYGRKRSNTAQSLARMLPVNSPSIGPLKVGDSKVLTIWVHDPKDSPKAVLNQSCWPGVTEGDLLRVTQSNDTSGYLFTVPKDEGSPKPNLQISLPRNVADAFGWKIHTEVTLTKVDKDSQSIDYVEFTFADQYLGRNEMWRLGKHLAGQCIFVDQEISFIGVIAAKVQNIYVKGKQVSSGYVTPRTKAIYRSLSAKVTIFIQVCRELWQFAGDGEHFYEKIVHSFLPTLFSKWREAGTNHTVTIVLISRVHYDATELEYAAGPLRWDEDGRWYKDFFKVITDLETITDWKPTLFLLKDSFWAFQRDILLTHHYHQASMETKPHQARLVGQISYAHDGPILEALNLGLNPNETHYIDRSLSSTGVSTILITPGTGYFRVSKQLLRLTTTRMLDQGFGLDLVSLAKAPLHQSPIFSFQGYEPRLDRDGKHGSRDLDPLWGGDESPNDAKEREKVTFWWEPFWIGVSFWDKQVDLPFRRDRFVARAKMHEIQMLGLLEHDVLSTIEVPFMPEFRDTIVTPRDSFTEDRAPSAAEADQADLDLFASKKERPPNSTRTSYASSSTSTAVPSSHRPSITSDRRILTSHRTSVASTRIAPIEESPPRQIILELPPEGDEDGPIPSVTGLSTSPSQSSLRSSRSVSTTVSTGVVSENVTPPSASSRLAKLTPSWLYNPFRSNQAGESPVSSNTPEYNLTPSPSTPTPAVRVPIAPNRPITPSPSVSRSPQPMAILQTASGRTALSRTYEEEPSFPIPHRGSMSRYSPLNTPPRDDPAFGKRRSVTLTSSFSLPTLSSSSVSSSRTNPSRPQSAVSYTQSSLARRWEHNFPVPVYKHEVKWKSMVTPSCLPLTVEHFPSTAELESSYDVFSYDFVVDPSEMRSFLVKPPSVQGTVDEVRRAWALVVMRGMVAVRLAQGFQFVLRSKNSADEKSTVHRPKSFMGEEDTTPKQTGAAEVLMSTTQPVYLSMSNEIHMISYTGEAIQVRRYVRRMPPTQPFDYECLIWPKLGVGYTELKTKFVSHGSENYGWNRLDMLVAGYEHQFNESLRYWRTRFVVIPSAEPPEITTGPSGEKMNEDETRLMGIDKLAEIFTKARWQPADERGQQLPAVRFLPTTLSPAYCVLDESLMPQLDEIHAAGPLKKKMKSEREVTDMSLSAIAKAMRDEDGVPIKLHRWHRRKYPDSFTGFDFVSWLVREFRDISSREQATECGAKLLEQGLFTHCTGRHGFLDGHYFYQLCGEYVTVSTPSRGGWFKAARHTTNEDTLIGRGYYPSSQGKPSGVSPKRTRKRLILTQSMIIDMDPGKKSDQAESVVLHHDIIQNPGTVFHFELQWIGSTARCIEDTLRQWSRAIERYGLKLVEAYVTEIGDVRDRNAFQSCFPLRLAIPPPIVPDLEKRIPEYSQSTHYFEYALLKRFGFSIDIEAMNMYPKDVDVAYSYRRAPFKYSQFVHRSGVAFVQVLGGSQGFLFLTNRLMGPGRMGAAIKSRDHRPAAAADEIRIKLHELCSDEVALMKFYDEELAALGPDDPPPLSI